jgi:hypothetical protein
MRIAAVPLQEDSAMNRPDATQDERRLHRVRRADAFVVNRQHAGEVATPGPAESRCELMDDVAAGPQL